MGLKVYGFLCRGLWMQLCWSTIWAFSMAPPSPVRSGRSGPKFLLSCWPTTDGALKSVDAIVTKADGAHFLWATVRFVLNVKPPLPEEERGTTPTAAHLRLTGTSRKGLARHKTPGGNDDEKARPFPPRVWRHPEWKPPVLKVSS